MGEIEKKKKEKTKSEQRQRIVTSCSAQHTISTRMIKHQCKHHIMLRELAEITYSGGVRAGIMESSKRIRPRIYERSMGLTTTEKNLSSSCLPAKTKHCWSWGDAFFVLDLDFAVYFTKWFLNLNIINGQETPECHLIVFLFPSI